MKAPPIEITVSVNDYIADIRKFVKDNNFCVNAKSREVIMKRINDLMEKRKSNNPTIAMPTITENTNANVNNDRSLLALPSFNVNIINL